MISKVMKLTDDQWISIKPFFPSETDEDRHLFEGILEVFENDFMWEELTQEYPAHILCRKKFIEWSQTGTLKLALRALVRNLRAASGIDLSETFIYGTDVKEKNVKSIPVNPTKDLWQMRTIGIFQNKYPLRVLHSMRLDSLEQRLGQVIHETYLSEIYMTLLTVQIHFEQAFEAIDARQLIPSKVFSNLEEL